MEHHHHRNPCRSTERRVATNGCAYRLDLRATAGSSWGSGETIQYAVEAKQSPAATKTVMATSSHKGPPTLGLETCKMPQRFLASFWSTFWGRVWGCGYCRRWLRGASPAPLRVYRCRMHQLEAAIPKNSSSYCPPDTQRPAPMERPPRRQFPTVRMLFLLISRRRCAGSLLLLHQCSHYTMTLDLT